MAKKAESEGFLITDHVLVPKHELLSEDDKNKIMKEYDVVLQEFPKIKITDPAIQHLGVKEGDVIKITRESSTAGTTVFYRVVVSE